MALLETKCPPARVEEFNPNSCLIRLPEALRDEVVPKNILMIGPTGCGKTEIARRCFLDPCMCVSGQLLGRELCYLSNSTMLYTRFAIIIFSNVRTSDTCQFPALSNVVLHRPTLSTLRYLAFGRLPLCPLFPLFQPKSTPLETLI